MTDLFNPAEVTEDEVDAAWVGLWAHSELMGGNDGTVLAFDLGQKFAWALLERGVVAMSGWYDTKRKGEGGGAELFRFRTAMRELVENSKPTCIAWESPSLKIHGSAGITKMVGLLETECTERQIPYSQINASSLKLWATGKGNSSKDAMRACLIIRMDGP